MKKSPNKNTTARKTADRNSVVRKKPVSKKSVDAAAPDYNSVLSGVVELSQEARRASARTANAIMTATYWEVGRRIVEGEQAGKERADYCEELIQRLSADLTARFGHGFGQRNVFLMKSYFLVFAPHRRHEIVQTPSGLFVGTNSATLSRNKAAMLTKGVTAEAGRCRLGR